MQGLTQQEAKKRLEKYGENSIRRQNSVSPLKLLLKQFSSPLILILVAVAIISIAIGYLPGQEPHFADSILIGIIVLFSSVLGFIQEYKAEKTIEALQEMSTPETTVIRDGKKLQIPTTEVVPGDIALIEEGNVVPADGDILETKSIQINEASLTGESEPVDKSKEDEVYMNTYITSGSAKMKVTKTNMKTKVGQIADELQNMEDDKTPFQREVEEFSNKVFWFILALIVIMGVVGLFKYSLYTAIFTSISLAVAAIPEGLPAVIALTLAIGARSMSKKNALIRKLAVTESIGSVDVICTDKTGTLTRNEMEIEQVYTDEVYVSDSIDESSHTNKLLICSVLCNNADLQEETGDPTELALLKLADDYGVNKNKLEQEYKLKDEIPFDSDRKMMSVVVEKEGKDLVFTKGAPEILINKCDRIYQQGEVSDLTDEQKRKIIEKNKDFAGKGLRVLGFAYKQDTGEEVEENLVWIGLEAMMDPARSEVKESLKQCKTAGIEVVMMTGDNPLTAKAIADKVGLESGNPIVGEDIEDMAEDKLLDKIKSGSRIFARVSPFHKLKILKALKENHRVAMTGDGVNDSLALKRADVGVSMGIKGTEVAKQASDIILLDDNFATIVAAVKEGRRIFDNIKKFINYLFATNFAEVAIIFIGTVFFAFSEPILLPVQILWVNLLTDGLPALALGADPAKKDIMERGPRKGNNGIIDKELGTLIVGVGTIMTVVLFISFFLVLDLGMDIARTTLFTGLVLFQLVRIGNIRHNEKLDWWSNKYLLGALVSSIVLQVGLIYSPVGKYLDVVPLGVYPWIVLIGGSITAYLLVLVFSKFIVGKNKK